MTNRKDGGAANDPIQMAIDAIENIINRKTVAENDECYDMNVGIHNKAISDGFDDLRDAALALTALRQHREGWLPIESAPKDGTKVLLSHGNPNKNSPRHCFIGGFSTQYQQWIMDGGACTDGNQFTRWQPLPPAPKKEDDDDSDR